MKRKSTNQELSHYGILGMKWGVRRYQNSDGTLTDAGRKRYSSTYKAYSNSVGDSEYRKQSDDINSHLNKRGVTVGDSYDVVRKGTNLSVSTRSNQYKKTSYVSDRDIESNYEYESVLDSKGQNKFGDIYKTTSKASKDLKVAKAKDVASHIVNQYGDRTVKEAFSDILLNNPDYTSAGKENYGLYTSRKSKAKEDSEKYYLSQMKVLDNFMDRVSRDDRIDEVFKYYQSQGFDAVIDPVEALYSDYPLKVLNPRKSVKTVSSKKIWDAKRQEYNP